MPRSPSAGSDDYFSRLEVMIAAMLRDEGVRLPGTRRHKLVAAARSGGLQIGDASLAELLALSGKKSV